MDYVVAFIVGSVSLATVFLLGSVGEIITEKAGQLNLGIPGIMCAGTAGGCMGVDIYMRMFSANPMWVFLVLFSLIFAVVFAAAVGMIYGFLTISLHCNQNITGLAVTTFGVGFTQFVMDNFVDRAHFFDASDIIKSSLPFWESLGWFGEIFLSHGVLVYLAIAIAIAAWWVIKKTKVGLHLRAVGENPATADAAGINVNKYKYLAVAVGSGIAGIGGYFYIMDYIGGSWENAMTIEALGWLSVALVIFTIWRPNLSIIGSIVFAGLYTLAYRLTGTGFVITNLLKLLPYVITILVLIITSIVGSKNIQPPASLGLNYFREER
ncbi:MAG: ABC transporter permease [Clostridia bacterium]|nr:ABC transporter permease [Clostridia bacterium]